MRRLALLALLLAACAGGDALPITTESVFFCAYEELDEDLGVLVYFPNFTVHYNEAPNGVPVDLWWETGAGWVMTSQPDGERMLTLWSAHHSEGPCDYSVNGDNYAWWWDWERREPYQP